LVVTPNGYKASKLYSVIPSTGAGDMDVVRATTATRVNSSGLIESVAVNVPRIDYTNGSCPSLLVEPQRTNLITYSEQFDNAAWTKLSSSITANATTSPSGNIDADKLVESNLLGVHRCGNLSGTLNGTFSFYAKSGERTKVAIFSTIIDLGFNLSNGTLIDLGSGTSNGKIESVGNGWYRCSLYQPISITSLYFGLLDNSGNVSYTGNGTSGAFFWGAQIETGTYPTSYIPTVASSVTRNADVISKTGISSLIGQTEGTIFVEEVYDSSVLNSGGLDDTLISLTDGTSNNLISIFHYGGGIGTILFFIRLSNTTQVAISSSKPTSGTYKIALAYKNNDVVGYINGIQIGTDTSATIPTTSVVTFYDPITTNSATKTVNIKSAQLYKTRLTNTELAQLTTI
jgi:hypothetical protein